jgi:hypothetical protein
MKKPKGELTFLGHGFNFFNDIRIGQSGDITDVLPV